MTYKKVYHDNVRRSIRSETLYTPDQLAHEISVIAYSILDNLTDHNNDTIMNQIIDEYLVLVENEEDIDTDLYEDLFDDFYLRICSRLELIFGVKHRLNGGDYDIIMEEGDQNED